MNIGLIRAETASLDPFTVGQGHMCFVRSGLFCLFLTHVLPHEQKREPLTDDQRPRQGEELD